MDNDGDNSKDAVPRKTYGKTPNGEMFEVPTTEDMVTTLFHPSKPKSISDILIVVTLAFQIFIFYLCPARIPIFLTLFVFWRCCYNIGIGWLLLQQSYHKRLVKWARQWKLFERDPMPWRFDLLQRELRSHLGPQYEMAKMPIEYNTWLVFRRIVDLTLMNDFIAYILLAVATAQKPTGEGIFLFAARWIGGIGLVLFNLWVKLDAHRVVKDFAWYWGDFFFIVQQNLTFDGVFEMAPHPMYSVGYAGYYGFSMMSASYIMLFASLVAHAMQFAFLSFVENPHIEKTYNPPKPRKRSRSQSDSLIDEGTAYHDLVILKNFDFFRVADVSLFLLMAYTLAFAAVVKQSSPLTVVLIVHAFLWRFFHSIVLGLVLIGQSQRKAWTRRFIKFGESQWEAWRQWKSLYNMSLCMTHTSFAALCWVMYSLPERWQYGTALLRHTVGLLLITLQIWTASSIYESLHDYGWFYGDFFLDKQETLTYSGIYRYLNNPERLIGSAGLWGAAIITYSRPIFVLAVTAQIFQLLFLQFVERPHMQKLYGNQIRREAGLTKNIKRAIPKEMYGSVDRILGEISEAMDDFLEDAAPKLRRGMTSLGSYVRNLLNQYPARLAITRAADDLDGFDTTQYKLELVRESTSNPPTFKFGQPIHVEWSAPANHGKKDWIALYRVGDNVSRRVTRISSMGRWIPVVKEAYNTEESGTIRDGSTNGEVSFYGPKLFWGKGQYEVRYHHDGTHTVMAISPPFEIVVERCYSSQLEDVEEVLFGLVKACVYGDDELAAPQSSSDDFLLESGGEVYARRIGYAIRATFGIELASEVVKADANVKTLAWRIIRAKEVLEPFTFSSAAPSTPISEPMPEPIPVTKTSPLSKEN